MADEFLTDPPEKFFVKLVRRWHFVRCGGGPVEECIMTGCQKAVEHLKKLRWL